LFGFASLCSAASPSTPPSISAAITDPARPAADTERDGLRKPAETLTFAGIKPGDQVLELGAGKGYFTRLLSAVAGPQGSVTIYTVSAPPKPDQLPPPLKAIIADAHYANVHLNLERLIDAKPSATFDLVWTTQNYHDFHNVPGIDMAVLNRAIFDSLKPGGVYFVLDHAAEAGSGARDTNTLHRIDRATVIEEVRAAGFVLAGEGDFLRNSADPHSAKVFDASIQGHTDQFALKFRKPKP
jgi:predicted methyltransferase